MAENTPGWHPDPAARHEYRWWDGSAWTDQVANDGAASTDPLGAGATAAEATAVTPAVEPVSQDVAPPAPQPTVVQPAYDPTASMPSVGASPAAGAFGGGPPSYGTPSPQPVASSGGSGGGGNNKLPLIIGGVVAIVALAAGAFVLLGGGDDKGFNEEFAASVGENEIVTRDLELEAGEAAGVRVEPSDNDFDPMIAVGVSDATSDSFADFIDNELEFDSTTLYDQNNLEFDADGVDVNDDIARVVDLGSDGDEEEFAFVAPAAGTYRIIIRGFDISVGDMNVVIETEAAPDDFADEPSLDEVNDAIKEHASFFRSFGESTDGLEAPTTTVEETTTTVEETTTTVNPGLDRDAFVAIVAEGIRSTSTLDELDSLCLAGVVVDTIGLDVLLQAGLDSQGGDLSALAPEVQTQILDATLAGITECGIDISQLGG